MPPIRNSSVARGAAAAGSTTLAFTVPADTVLLLKDVHWTAAGAPPYGLNILLYTSDTTVGLYLLQDPAPTTQSGFWSGWIALNAGDFLYIQPTTLAVNYWVSGALLPFVPGF